MSKFIFVTGGVVSSLGKGIAGASLGKLLQLNGFKVNMIKCDPYLNVDPGNMSPFQHGEVFVTVDGAETDLDLGYYERFLGVPTTRANTNTAGGIYLTVLDRERKGLYNGLTVQVIPHITDEIKKRFTAFEKDYDVTIIEIGGTVGDIESLPFIEAARQLKLERPNKVLSVHLTLIPYIKSSDELKTKPTQHSVIKLRELGINPDMLFCRTDRPLSDSIKQKISLFCSVPKEAVIEASDKESIYLVPENFYKQNADKQIMKMLGLKPKQKFDATWFNFINKNLEHKETVDIAMVGKYSDLKDAYKSVNESLFLSGMSNKVNVNIIYVNAEKDNIKEKLANVHGILIPGGFGPRGMEGKIEAVKIARESHKPLLGLCVGMQCIFLESARRAGLKDADSAEFNTKTKNPVITLMEKYKEDRPRCGNAKVEIEDGSKAFEVYGTNNIEERHRHRYALNTKYVDVLEKAGLKISGWSDEIAEIVELPTHPFFIGVQYHPEFGSRPMHPHPLFRDFIKEAKKQKNKK
ncbi:CTP synthase [Elusimicrobium minutum Pei191]|uniref:CTP synthase (glutamine hydrolyzing) n=1 Tax=Elusimicrobium minutum (strain Pei191) TaxID=445932 RepID=B2KD63_ELUMP|nr:CTP synthase [Elusimicrobium minutum]ACC98459.1 CTP synthase [Elusimicrobium minutum Pei191]